MEHVDPFQVTGPHTNEGGKFGEARTYFQAIIKLGEVKMPMLFTAHEIQDAIIRAEKNPEDAPQVLNWWERLKRWWDELPDRDDWDSN